MIGATAGAARDSRATHSASRQLVAGLCWAKVEEEAKYEELRKLERRRPSDTRLAEPVTTLAAAASS